jgi:hypothetical protein
MDRRKLECESERSGKVKVSPRGLPNSCESLEEKDKARGVERREKGGEKVRSI